jgi:hypothetical protein
MSRDTRSSRRRFLRWASVATVGGLAGCGGDGDDGPTETASPTSDEDEVPEQYRTATAIGGQERDPDSLSAKSDVNYQDSPNEGNQCSGCTFYITDKNGDGVGACAIVAGNIDPEGWCVSYAPHETDG